MPIYSESQNPQQGEISVDVPDEGRGVGGSHQICAEEARRCGFTDARSNPEEVKERSASMRKLLKAAAVCIVLTSVEVVGGIKANSLALFTDMFFDVTSFAISLFCLWAAGWEATHRHSYGFLRIETLGALFSILLTWLFAGILVYNAILRLIHETGEVNGMLMFIVAAIGLAVNVIMAFLLVHDHHHHDGNHETKKRNINVQGVYLHVLGECIQSIGVMIGDGIIWYKPELKIVDPIFTLICSVIVTGTTIKMLRNVLEVLMESTPREIDATKLEEGVLEMEEVVAVHELHIWAIKVLMSCHVKIRSESNGDVVLDKVINYIKREYNISHITIQIQR